MLVGLTMWGMVLSSPALAGASADFSDCDGLRKPKAKDDGMRGNATMSRYGFNLGHNTIASCTRALERKQLKPTQNLRRAHLLRARAAAYLKQENTEAALADLDAAEAEVETYRGKFFFDRSMGLSLDLLRAVALSDAGDDQQAFQLAQTASQARPYSMPIQMAAAIVLDRHAPEDADRVEIWQNLARIEPKARTAAKSRIKAAPEPSEWFANIAESALDEPFEFRPIFEFLTFNTSVTSVQVTNWIKQYTDALNVTYALAASGQPAQAQARFDEIQNAIVLGVVDEVEPEDGAPATEEQATEEQATEEQATAEMATAEMAAKDEEVNLDESAAEAKQTAATQDASIALIEKELMGRLVGQRLQSQFAMINARLALANKQPEQVAMVLGDGEYPATLMAQELYSAYDQYRAASDSELPDLTPLGPEPLAYLRPLSDLGSILLLAPEDERQLIDYEKSRPDVLRGLVSGALSLGLSLLGGFQRTEGFKSEEMDDGRTKVEYLGSSSSASVVQEMTLLRAAEIASEAGQSNFVIDQRQDFARYMANAYQRTLNGYKTILFVSYPKDAQDSLTAINAVEVIDTLGPIYYKES